MLANWIVLIFVRKKTKQTKNSLAQPKTQNIYGCFEKSESSDQQINICRWPIQMTRNKHNSYQRATADIGAKFKILFTLGTFLASRQC